MDTYTILRHFADSWGLLFMVLFFVGVVLFTFRPGSRVAHDDAGRIPLRHEDHPLSDAKSNRKPHEEARK